MVVQSLFPILLTHDLPRLADFYERALDGTVDYRFDDGGEDVYVSLTIGAASLGIGKDAAAPDASAGDRVALWFYVDDVDGNLVNLGARPV
jgi:predicted enzyme related to lactoylglutathione lyase